MDTSSTQSFDIQETFIAYKYRIYKLDFCFYNFDMFRFSRSDRREVDVYRFKSKHGSDHFVLFCHDPLSHLDIDPSSCTEVDAYKDRFFATHYELTYLKK